MSIDRIVMAFAGVVIWAGLVGFYFTKEELWLVVPAFVGLNLFQAAFTSFCPLATILKKMGAKPGQAFN
ncbi:MAG: DUF2892 domain-containing protein [Magnetovibrio sp.]|nr:DUF2892 domain-containing protein [Magnetovibrio sp.]